AARPCQVVDGDQAPVTVSVRNRDAIDRGGIARSLALLGALRRGLRDVERANRDRGANAHNAKNLPGGPKRHDLLPSARDRHPSPAGLSRRATIRWTAPSRCDGTATVSQVRSYVLSNRAVRSASAAGQIASRNGGNFASSIPNPGIGSS